MRFPNKGCAVLKFWALRWIGRYPLWQVAEKHQVPVLFHFGIMGAAGGIMDHVNMSPKIIQNVAKAFPDVIFIVPHYGCSKVEDTLFLCWVCPNVIY